MYQLTETERASLMDGMKALFREYGYRYTERAINTILDEWASNKGELITLFKKHPNYVEGKFLIALEREYSRSIEGEEVNYFTNWLHDKCISKTTYINALPEEVTTARKAERCICLPDKMYCFFRRDSCGMKFIIRQFLTQEDADYINGIFPTIKATKGQKTSRVINKICNYLGYDKHPDYNKEFAKYADALNPMSITRPTILSVNPLDYLTMSFGNSWASCHTIDKKNKRHMDNCYSGCYSSGTISYMLDESSFVLYTVDSSYTGTDYFLESKVNRQMYHYGEEKLVQARLYPQANDGFGDAYTNYRNIAQEVMATCLGIPNLWTVSRGTDAIDDYVASYGTHYRDYLNFSSCTLSRIQGSTNDRSIGIGHEPICIECGDEHHDEECINCCHEPTRGWYTCAECGEDVEQENSIDIDGKHYCRHCVKCCSHCGRWMLTAKAVKPKGLRSYVCEDCASHRVKCEKCGKYGWDTDIVVKNGKHICNECYTKILLEETRLDTSREPIVGDYVLIRPDLTRDHYYGEYGKSRSIWQVTTVDMVKCAGKVARITENRQRGHYFIDIDPWDWVSGMFAGILTEKPEGVEEIEAEEFPF